MLKKENRLKKNKHFNFIYKHGTSVKIDSLTLIYNRTKFKTYKVGFSVGKKIGKAVVRNKVKRRLKEAFSALSPLVDKRYNYIFVCREGIEQKTFLEIKDNMFKILQKAGLLNENASQNNTISI